MMMMKILLVLFLPVNILYASSDERSIDHRDQDRRYNDCQRETGAREYERHAPRESWTPEPGVNYDTKSEAREERGTCGPPDRDK